MKTYSPKPEHIERRWYVVDAADQVLGRLASEVAALLRGKHKPIFAPHMDTGDHVIVINADKVTLTGGKELKKVSYRHSGYPGGISGVRYDVLLADRPVFAVEKAIRGMLPKNRLGRSMIRKLHVVAGAEHPHGAQKPVGYTFGKPPKWEGLPTPKGNELKTRHLTGADIKEPGTKPKDAKPEAGTTVPEPTPGESAAKASTAKKSTAKKTTAKKATAKKTTAKKTSAKKTTAKKTTAEKTTAKKATAKKATAKKTTAKKTTAKKATTKPATDETTEE
jgi:large subunit ribosomal protein L13